MIKIKWLIGFFLLAFSIQAQSFIYLKKKSSSQTKKIYLGQQLGIKSAKTAKAYKGLLVQVSDEFVVVGDETFYLADIESITTYNSTLQAMTGNMAIAVGAFATVFAINNAVHQGEAFNYSNFEVYWMLGTVVATGVLWVLTRKNHKSINGWSWETYKIDMQ